MNKKQKITIIAIAFALILVFSGITYAYFTSFTPSETGSTIVAKGGTMNIVYANGSGNITMENIYPKEEAWVNKVFTITGENSTELAMSYKIYLQTTSNSFNLGDLTYSISGTSTNSSDTLVTQNNKNISKAGALLLGVGTFKSKTATHSYNLRIFYKETNEDQNNGQGKSYTGYVKLENETDLAYDCLMVQDPTPDRTDVPTFNGNYPKDAFEEVYFKNTSNVPSNAIDSWDASAKQNGSVMAYILDEDNDGLYELYIGQDGGVIANPNSARTFNYFTKVTKYDFTYYDTSKATTMLLMFSNNTSLETIDVSNLDTSNVTNLMAAFQLDGKLKEINGVNNWNTSKATSIQNIFYGCTELTSIDLTGWNTSNIQNFSAMFERDNKLATIKGIEDFDTSSATNLSYIFKNTAIESLDLSKWDVSNAQHLTALFRASKLKTLTGISNWDVSNAYYMHYMFDLTNIDTIDISNWKTNGNLKYTTFMFSNANISNIYMNNMTFDTVTNNTDMFKNSTIGNIYVKDATVKTWIEARLTEAGKTSNVQIAS